MVNFCSPRQSLNKAFLKVSPVGYGVDRFVQNLLALLGNVRESETEEFHKNLISDFLKKSWLSAIVCDNSGLWIYGILV